MIKYLTNENNLNSMRKSFGFVIIIIYLLIVVPIPNSNAEKPPYKLNQEIQINTDDYWENEQWQPSLAAYENNIYITWWDIRNDTEAVYISKSIDGGNNFSGGKYIGNLPSALDIVIDNQGIIYGVSHFKGNITFTKSIDKGDSFTYPIKINDNQGDGQCSNPVIAVDSDENIYIAWDDKRNKLPAGGVNNFDIYFAKSTDKGNTFEDNIRVNDDLTINDQTDPCLAVSKGGDVFVAWTDLRNDYNGSIHGADWDIYIAQYNKNYNSFDKNIRVNSDTSYKAQFGASIAIDNSDNIFVTWNEYGGGYGPNKLYFSESTVTDMIFAKDVFITNGSGGSINIDDKGIYILNDNDLIYSVDGISFYSPMGMTPYPIPYSFVLDNQSNIYITWVDVRNGKEDIYFVKGIRTELSDGNDNNGQNGIINENGLETWIWITTILLLTIISVAYVIKKQRDKNE